MFVDQQQIGVYFQPLEGNEVHDVVALDLALAVSDVVSKWKGGGAGRGGGIEFPFVFGAVGAFLGRDPK